MAAAMHIVWVKEKREEKKPPFKIRVFRLRSEKRRSTRIGLLSLWIFFKEKGAEFRKIYAL